MIFLAVTVFVFAILHLIPAFPTLKERLKGKAGAAWGPGFGILSTLTLIAIVFAWRWAPFEHVYDPPAWGPVANLALLFFAFLFVAMFFFRGRLRRRFRFPLAIAVLFWSAGHLVVNGDAASIILFAGLGAYGLIHLVAGIINGVRPDGDARDGHDIIALIAGTAMFIIMVQLHPVVIGKHILEIPGRP